LASRIESPIGFSDSELLSYSRSGSALVVQIQAWNERRVRLEFAGVLAMRDLGAGGFSDVRREDDVRSSFLSDALRANYVTAPTEHSYASYLFVNNDGETALEVVAARCEVVVEPVDG
jgi:hypothetical protein